MAEIQNERNKRVKNLAEKRTQKNFRYIGFDC